MKEDVVAANLANLRQSINELKECVNRQNVTPNQPEQHIKVDLDEKTIYNGVAKSFCTCWNDALSVVKKHIWNQQPDTLPFSLLIVSVNRYHRSARIGTIIAEEPVPL